MNRVDLFIRDMGSAWLMLVGGGAVCGVLSLPPLTLVVAPVAAAVGAGLGAVFGLPVALILAAALQGARPHPGDEWAQTVVLRLTGMVLALAPCVLLQMSQSGQTAGFPLASGGGHRRSGRGSPHRRSRRVVRQPAGEDAPAGMGAAVMRSVPARAPDVELASDLFDLMAPGYDRVALAGSLGLAALWRRRVAGAAALRRGDRVVDLMCGTGNLWPAMVRRGAGSILGIDLSAGMCDRARRRRLIARATVRRADASATGLPDGSADAVVCAFGLKTLDAAGLDAVVVEASRLLRPGGTLVIAEMSVPRAAIARSLYLASLRRMGPAMARLLRADPRPHRALAGYVAAFGDGRRLGPVILRSGLRVREWRPMTLGCALLIVAEKGRA